MEKFVPEITQSKSLLFSKATSLEIFEDSIS